jgi:tRNA threonylcarbamoyladenosine biosynthesis protein TsaB
MLLLAFDTATPLVGAALHDGERVLAICAQAPEPARRHGELLAPAIEEVLARVGAAPGDLTDVAVGTGPGPFTGLRVGLVTAHALGLTLGVPVHGVCTLDALALHAVRQGAVGERPFVVATDARRREVYWAGYRSAPAGLPTRVDGPRVDRAGDLPRAGRPTVGRGADLYPEALGARVGPADPDAGALATWAVLALAAGADLSDLTPRYLRRPDVHAGGGRKSVLA